MGPGVKKVKNLWYRHFTEIVTGGTHKNMKSSCSFAQDRIRRWGRPRQEPSPEVSRQMTEGKVSETEPIIVMIMPSSGLSLIVFVILYRCAGLLAETPDTAVTHIHPLWKYNRFCQPSFTSLSANRKGAMEHTFLTSILALKICFFFNPHLAWPNSWTTLVFSDSKENWTYFTNSRFQTPSDE